jgi:DNA-binding MurR/RpiR family transcriptional regulator
LKIFREINEGQRLENFEAKLRLLKPRLSPKEQKLLEFLLTYKGDPEGLSTLNVARVNGVSSGLLVRMCRKLGYSGYRAFKKELIKYQRSRENFVIFDHEEIKPSDSSEEVLQKIFATSIKALHDTLSVMDIAKFEQAVEILVNANHIDLYGVGGSGAIAYDMCHKLIRIGIRANCYTDGHLMLMSAALLRRGDAVLAISHSGETNVVVKAAQIARKNGAGVVALTNRIESSLAQIADVVLYSIAQGSPLTGENAAARIAQLNILDAIFVSIAQRNYNEAVKALHSTIEAVKSQRVRDIS